MRKRLREDHQLQTTFGALAASQAIALFEPRYVAFVGLAGGFDRDGQRHGDVAVPSVVTAYEYGKVDTGGFAPRANFTYRCNEALVRATDAARATGARWWSGKRMTPWRTGPWRSGVAPAPRRRCAAQGALLSRRA